MKNILLITLLLFTVSITWAQQKNTTTYTCVMHPEIHAAKPGNCPKCGMKLIKEKPKAVKQPAVQKHDEMKMTKDTVKPKPMNMKDTMQMKFDSKEGPATYTCPMHPEIKEDKPGTCPKCGMKLIKEKPKAVADSSGNKQGKCP